MYETPNTLQRLRTQALWAEDTAIRSALLEASAAFAFFTVQNTTRKAEEMLAYWDSHGRFADASLFPAGMKPRFPNSMTKQLESLSEALSSGLADKVWTLCGSGDDWAAAELLSQTVRGLGCAKACFTLACAGIGSLACLDVHIVRRNLALLGDTLTPSEVKECKAPVTWRRYREACKAMGEAWGTPNDHATGQWAYWFENFVTYTDHSVLLGVMGA